jgi:hypothetical protein
VLKLLHSQRSFFYFAGTADVALKGDQCEKTNFIIIPNTQRDRDRFCGLALEQVTSEFQMWCRVISEL